MTPRTPEELIRARNIEAILAATTHRGAATLIDSLMTTGRAPRRANRVNYHTPLVLSCLERGRKFTHDELVTTVSDRFNAQRSNVAAAIWECYDDGAIVVVRDRATGGARYRLA